MKIFIAAVAALFVAGAAYAQTPTTKESVRNEPRDAPISKDRDSMPKPNPNTAQQGSGAMQETPKKQ